MKGFVSAHEASDAAAAQSLRAVGCMLVGVALLSSMMP